VFYIYPRRFPMVSIHKVVGVLSCSFLLCLGLSTVASSAEQFNAGHSGGKIWTVEDKDRFVSGKEVKGEIVKIDGENYVVREASGAEERMHVDSNSQKRSMAPKVGDHVLAKVDAKGHAVSFLTDASVAH
jgi:preprotein translocase subunit SecF